MESPGKDTLLAALNSNSPILKINLKDLLNGPIEIVTRAVLKLFCDIIHALIDSGLKAKVKAALGGSQICLDLLLNLCRDCGKSIT